MNRRGFLAALAGAFVTDPERLLWVPGKKLISIPAPPKVFIQAGWYKLEDLTSHDWVMAYAKLKKNSEIIRANGGYLYFAHPLSPIGRIKNSPLGRNGG